MKLGARRRDIASLRDHQIALDREINERANTLGPDCA
jgi:hypothetical protein